MRAAWVDAAGGTAAITAAPDVETLERVRGALLGRLGGVMPARPEGTGCGDPMPRRVPDPDVQRAGRYAGAMAADLAGIDDCPDRFDAPVWLRGVPR